ncbi:MAG TPA: Fe-S cluster assembly ATPase SufC [Lachnospiraceae bacterium]|nr:Fe-S cluster assembly ATPase SufC [Lachnospiraceae bacterium]HCR41738.1 Fe-S cluster assembly ATPase SufC [Lachnospiraceae bacterium]
MQLKKKELLNIKNLHVATENKEILKGLDLVVNQGEIHVIMGPNGAGKSTLMNAIMGHPKYEVTKGGIFFEGEEITGLKTDERARKGIFLSFQTPEEVPGITVEGMLKSARFAATGKPVRTLPFRKEMKEKMELLHFDEDYAQRYLNVGFSGGEKKKSEILQMTMLAPKLAILDEIDSGLDVDAVRDVADSIHGFLEEEKSLLIITHNSKLLDYIKPDLVHILMDGRIVKTGDASLAEDVINNGFTEYKEAVNS